MDYEVVLVDATESPIERPKKQKFYYSGKKKRHTLKTQIGSVARWDVGGYNIIKNIKICHQIK